MLDPQLKDMARDWAEKTLHEICAACNSPSYKIEGDSLKTYEDLKDWGWLDKFQLDQDNSEEILLILLSMQKYAKLKWAKDHPPKKKLSKWEVVMGVANKKK